MSLVECIQDQGPYYRKLKVELESESNVERELTATKANRQNVESQIKTKRAEINALEQQSKKEFKEVRKLRNLSFRSAAATLSGRKKEKMEKEEAKYQLAFENEQRSKRRLEELQAEYDLLISKEAQLAAQKSHFVETRGQYDSLIEQIFQIEDPQFPSEPQLKAELRNYTEQSRLAIRDKSRFTEAEKALNVALLAIKKVIRVLDTVINYVPFEIFGGPIIDEEQIAYLEIAKRKIWAIQKLLNVARTVLPEIPYPQTLDVVTNNPLLNMQLNLNFVDIAWKAKTSQCFGMLAAVYRNTQNSISWVKQYKDYAVGAVKRLDSAIQTVKQTLRKERIRIIELVLSGQVTAATTSQQGASSDLPDPLISNYEAPPPVYEAPPPPLHEGVVPQNQSLPSIPSHFSSPIQSFANLSLNDADTNNNTPLPPITNTPDTNQSSHANPTNLPNYTQDNPSYQSYISTNVNNPFRTRE